MKKLLATIIIAFTVITVKAQNKTIWTLAEMISYASDHNISVKQAQLNQETAAINLVQSRAALFPSLSASGSQSISKGTSADPITYEFISTTIHSTSASLSAQLNIYNGNKAHNTIKENNLFVEQSELFAREASNNITLSITEAYLQALYYKEGITIAENNLKASMEQVKRTEALYHAGSLSAKDLADMKSQQASNQYTLVTSKNAFNMQLLTLKQLLEFEPNQEFDVATPEIKDEIITVPDKFDVFQKALEVMPEIKSSEIQRNIEVLDLKLASAGYKPTLSLGASLSTGYTNTQQFSFEEQFQNNFNQRLGLTLSVPIFSNLKTKSSVQQAKIQIRSAELDLMSEKKALYQKIETAHQNLTAALGEMEAVKAQVEAAQTAYDLSLQQHQLGLANTVDLLVSQNNHITAQQKFIQTKYTSILYYQLLQFYQGIEIKI